jgi:hypothetical protein
LASEAQPEHRHIGPHGRAQRRDFLRDPVWLGRRRRVLGAERHDEGERRRVRWALPPDAVDDERKLSLAEPFAEPRGRPVLAVLQDQAGL